MSTQVYLVVSSVACSTWMGKVLLLIASFTACGGRSTRLHCTSQLQGESGIVATGLQTKVLCVVLQVGHQ
jgi:hypothetical protein